MVYSMKIFEAMVKVPHEDCPMCAPGTTFKGTHENIVHMVTPAHSLEDAKEWFENFGSLFSTIHEVGESKI